MPPYMYALYAHIALHLTDTECDQPMTFVCFWLFFLVVDECYISKHYNPNRKFPKVYLHDNC